MEQKINKFINILFSFIIIGLIIFCILFFSCKGDGISPKKDYGQIVPDSVISKCNHCGNEQVVYIYKLNTCRIRK